MLIPETLTDFTKLYEMIKKEIKEMKISKKELTQMIMQEKTPFTKRVKIFLRCLNGGKDTVLNYETMLDIVYAGLGSKLANEEAF